MKTAVLLISCPDRRGLVALLSGFIADHGGNILHADHHIDLASNLFLMRIEWDTSASDLDAEEWRWSLAPLVESLHAAWDLRFSGVEQRVAVFVSRQDHCLVDLLWRQKSGELPAIIPLVISNHPELQAVARYHGAEFHCLPVTAENKLEQETQQRRLLREHDIDLVVLAKYMQIISGEFVDAYPRRMINIHHSFLPAFPGANPYQRAYERGVKIIGATAHYVTQDLDEGPIIEQDIVRISHRDAVPDLVRRGRDLERVVLARAVRYHLENRILVYGNKTVVFA